MYWDIWRFYLPTVILVQSLRYRIWVDKGRRIWVTTWGEWWG